MNQNLKSNIAKGNVILFLGAGASCSSKNHHGDNLRMGNSLAEHMSRHFSEPYGNESLKDVYSSIRFIHKERVNDYFEDVMRYCRPSDSYIKLAQYAWRRIYTINIDDAFDRALSNNRVQDINVCSMASKYRIQDQTFSRLDYIKLHGSVDRLQEGVIFSPEEYADISSQEHHWYAMLPQDYTDSVFLFIGTNIDEPALLKVLNDFKLKYKTEPGRHYLLIPSATTHQINSLMSRYNVEHLPGKLEDFTNWLESEFPKPLASIDLFHANNPGLTDILSTVKPGEQTKKYSSRELDVLTSVVLLNNSFFSKVPVHAGQSIEYDFYTGVKPTWSDIKSKIPAELQVYQSFRDTVKNNIKENIHISVLIGQAGSGKTTVLMQIAESLSKEIDLPLYYYDNSAPLDELIYALNGIHDRYVIFIDKLSNCIPQLLKIINEKKLDSCFIVCTERKNIWKKTCESRCASYARTLDVEKITKSDALKILSKLELYGRWTRLASMTKDERLNEFMIHSNKQILIALLESTRGKGFKEIIEDDYNNLESPEERSLVNLVGLFTLHNNTGIKKGNAFNALLSLHPNCTPDSIFNNLSGILYSSHGNVYARHPVYIEHLFTHVTNKHHLAEAIVAIVRSFSAYDVPYAKSLNKRDYHVFKSILNYRFLRHRVSDKNIIIDLFDTIGKQLENDGHYWLQYGLALKSYGLYEQAHDKLETSVSIYDQPHSRHALATLDMVLALSVDEKYKADIYFNASKEALESLDVDPRYRNDWYPIVSLAEGEIKYACKFLSLTEAKDKAKFYSNIIADRKKKISGNSYLERAWKHVTTFAVTGEWPTESFLENDIPE